jgi:diacylglycerol kinase family enzyme
MKALVILNPAAGKKSSEVVNESLAKHFGGVIEYDVYETKKSDKPGDIVRARLGDGYDLVVAAGGDGTVSAVADGLVGSAVPLGVIPVGTGNMLARELGLPIDIDKAVALIASAPHSRKIDAMKIDGLTRVLSASVGLSPLIIGGASRKSKNRFGNFAYYWSAARNAFNIKRRYVEVEIDGGTEQFRAVEVVVANCGKLFKKLDPLGPEISLDDGRLDVWILSTKSGFDYPLYICGLITGRLAKLRTNFFTAEKSVTIKSFHPLKVQVDGELAGDTPLSVELLPGALTVLVAENPGEDEDHDVIRDLYASRYPAYFRRSKWIKAKAPQQ